MDGSEQKKRTYFNIFKAFLMFCVIAGHGIETGIVENNALTSSVYITFYTFHMFAFIFLLGYFSKSTALSSQKIASRGIFFFALYALGKGIYYGGFKLINGALPSWTTGTFWAEDAPPWYMMSAAFFMASLWIARKVPAWIMLPVSIAAGLFCGAFPKIGGFLCLSRTVIYLPLFLIGFYFPKDVFDQFLAKKREWGWLGALGLALVWLLIWFQVNADPKFYAAATQVLYANVSFFNMSRSLWEGVATRAVFYIIGLMMTFFAAIAVAGFCSAGFGKSIEQAGRNTIAPYLMHYPLLLFGIQVLGAPLDPIAYIGYVVLIMFFWSFDIWERGLRLIQKGAMAFFGLFVKK